ncbi:MAG TPA: hypothetical protein VGC73_05460, partial [Pyrinomonadaceae bacterium]
MLRDASSLRILSIAREFMELLVNGVKVHLHSANRVVDYDLIAIHTSDSVGELTDVFKHGLLADFKTFLASLQLSNICDDLVPYRAGVVESLIHLPL